MGMNFATVEDETGMAPAPWPARSVALSVTPPSRYTPQGLVETWITAHPLLYGAPDRASQIGVFVLGFPSYDLAEQFTPPIQEAVVALQKAIREAEEAAVTQPLPDPETCQHAATRHERFARKMPSRLVCVRCMAVLTDAAVT